ncbi:hypothetical protein [Halomonas sp. E19]|uniref:hypothetical protein n=1 Tax=Halomonas sp. E19 TaxID=3397247 RepID=UPI004033B663
MLRWLTGKHPIPVWVIKQIDRDLLHLCGQGSVLPETRRSDVVASLHEDRYQGAVTLGGSGPVLNARLFAALVPVESLALETHGEAMWRGSRWLVSQVPQRCWAYEGRLVAKPPPPGSPHRWSAWRMSPRSAARPRLRMPVATSPLLYMTTGSPPAGATRAHRVPNPPIPSQAWRLAQS